MRTMPVAFGADSLLTAYYVATWPWRRQTRAQFVAAGKAPVLVLFYHRVAESPGNSWTIDFRRFRAQIEWIRRRYEIVPLEEAQRRMASCQNREPVVSLTFDDGYYDNCSSALPWLIRERVPFAYFVATQFVIQNLPFPHDVDAGVPLRPNTPDQIRELADAGVEIGAHTRTHANMGALRDQQAIDDEILGSRSDLEKLIRQPVRYFAFPFGLPANMSSQAFCTAQRHGFLGVCSAYGAYNVPGADPFHIQRFHGDPSWAKFRNWMTLDPRKLDRKPQFVAAALGGDAERP